MESTQQLTAIEGKKPSAVKRFLVVLLVTAAMIGGALYGAGYILIKGPSAYAGQQFVRSVGDKAVMQTVLKLYLSEAELESILSAEENGGQHFSVRPHAG